MADGGERRMVFDLRGRRRHVVKVVYAILAVLMGASLFLVVGPVNIGGLLGNGSSNSASSALDDQAANIERKLKKNPNDEALLLALTRTRISAGNTLVSVDPATGQQSVTSEARAEYQQAADAWTHYLKQAGDQPSPSLAQLAANALLSLAQTASTTAESDADIAAAARAQQIVADARPNLGTVSTFAIYNYFALNFKAGDKAAKQAEGLATTESQKKAVKKQLAQYRKNAKKYEKQRKAFEKTQKGQGKQELQNPLGGLSGAGAGTGSTLTP